MSETTWDVCTRECFWVGPYQESKEKFFKPLPPTSCFGGVSLVAQMVKNLPTMQKTRVQSLGQEDPLEEGMATHSSILAWRIPWTEESGRLQSMGSQRAGYN